MSRISVIVPVYNVEDCLDACMESLQAQSCADIDIVCVNDGSTDGSRGKLDSWVARDARIRIVDKPNGGLSSARNVGIHVAEAPYVCFLDSDDRLHPEACSEMVHMLEEAAADVLTFGASWVPEDAADPWLKDVLSPRDVVYEGFKPDLLFREASRPFAWRTACRTDFLRENGIFFDESVRFGEDQVFHFALYPRSARTRLSSARLYEYRVQRAGSLMDAVRHDPGFKMREHVKIIDPIFRDWARMGILDSYAAEMVSFALDFALYGALKLPDEEYRAIAEGVHGVLGRYWSAEAVAELGLRPQTQRLALEACYATNVGATARKVLALRYFSQQYGKKAALSRLVKGGAA